MKRQGLTVTIAELRNLADELEAEVQLNNFEITAQCGHNTKFQVNIINKSGDSDGWEFEKEEKVIMTGCPDDMEELDGLQ